MAVIHGFQDKIAALQFEWAWQHVHRSKTFREAVGCDVLARRMKWRKGVKARLDELRVLLMECQNFSSYPLRVYFPEGEYRDTFCKVLDKARNEKNLLVDNVGDLGDVDHSTDFLINIEVCSLENMPFAKDVAGEKNGQIL